MEQGNVFRHTLTTQQHFKSVSLNPFGTGQCLSTYSGVLTYGKFVLSQSLWNRAMSFDAEDIIKELNKLKSQSLWNRAMSFDNNPSEDPEDPNLVSIPLEQGNVFRRRQFWRK